jgi:hypothetical protein
MAQLFSTGVICSHNERPFYYLKRSYLETQVLAELLDRELGKDSVVAFRSLDELLDCALDLCNCVSLTVDRLKDARFCDHNTFEVFQTTEKTIAPSSRTTAGARSDSLDLSESLNTIREITGHVPGQGLETNPMREAYLHSVDTLERWISETHQDLQQLEAELIEVLYKLAAAVIGGCMGRYRVSSRLDPCEEQRLVQLDGSMMKGTQ